MPETQIEKDISEINVKLARIETKLDDTKELNHEDRIKALEVCLAKQSGFRKGVQYVVNFLIGLAGILIGKFFS